MIATVRRGIAAGTRASTRNHWDVFVRGMAELAGTRINVRPLAGTTAWFECDRRSWHRSWLTFKKRTKRSGK